MIYCTLSNAIKFATYAHEGQVRKYCNVPYIMHCLRVMHGVIMLSNSTEVMAIAAVLHDTIEDCDVNYTELWLKFGTEVADLVQELTNVSKIQHPEANRAERKRLDRERISGISKNAKIIKMIDRIDNLKSIPLSEQSFLKTYLAESKLLLEVVRDADYKLAEELSDLIVELKATGK